MSFVKMQKKSSILREPRFFCITFIIRERRKPERRKPEGLGFPYRTTSSGNPICIRISFAALILDIPLTNL